MPATYTDRLAGLATSVAAKAPCRVATTANIALNGLQTIDGVSVASGDRVLVKNQADMTENGIWNSDSGNWIRSLDFDGTRDAVPGTFVFVQAGTVNANMPFRVTGTSSSPVVIGTDAITFEVAFANVADAAVQVAEDAAQVAEDRAQADLDAAATAADRVQTGLDATSADASAILAAAARDAATISGKLFADTTTGLANTSSSGSTNRYFGVPSTDTTYVTEYRNDAGVATLVNTYPSLSGLTAFLTIPNGTLNRFLDLVATAGTTVSATAQAALLVVEQQLRQSGLLPKIVRLNLRCGVGVAAARIPFVQRAGCGVASDTGTISSWTEASGLTGATVNTGVTLQQGGLNGYNFGLFQYFLTDNSGGDLGYTIGASDITWGFSPRFAHETNPANPAFGIAVFTTFAGSGVARGDLTRRVAGVNTYPILGTFGASRDASGLAGFHRNGIMLTGASPAVDEPNPDIGPPTQAISVFTTNAASGGEAITEGLTPAEAAMLHIIMHGFNVAIGRGVTAEGL